MCCLRHPQYRWYDRRIQPRPNHSAGGNSEEETEDTSPSSNTPREEITPTYGATRNNANPNTCGTASTDSKRENKGTRAHRNLCSPLKRPPAGRDSSQSGRTSRPTPNHGTTNHKPSPQIAGIHDVLSCGCRSLKRSTSQRVAMLPARFLKPWEVLEMDIHGMEARSEAGNKHIPVIVDRASKFLFAYPLPNKTAENVAKKLLELLLNYGKLTLSLRSDQGTEFTAEVVQHLCKWLNATIDKALRTTQELRGCGEAGGVDP